MNEKVFRQFLNQTNSNLAIVFVFWTELKVPLNSDVSSGRIPWSAAFTKSENFIHQQTSSKLLLKKTDDYGIPPEFFKNSSRMSPEFFLDSNWNSGQKSS